MRNLTAARNVCANCGIVFTWQPTVVDGRVFCCVGCANGGPCECDYSDLPHMGKVRSIVVRRELHVIKAASRRGT